MAYFYAAQLAQFCAAIDNPNLSYGSEAKTWIGEVVGGSQTQLTGILEVAGPSLDMVLANEYEI